MKLTVKIFYLLIAFLIFNINTLHLGQVESSQLQQLKAKQKYLGQQVGYLISNSSSVKQKLRAAGSDQQKIEILEQALSNERNQVFDLKNKIIYPFNQSQTACEQLTDKQKVNILDKIEQTRNRLKQLQQINNKLDQTIRKVQGINDSIQKQYILLQNMQDILKTKCKENLSPTIFQTNLNTKNWILGPQTMNDLQEQYAQRALIFHNITNCPLQTPFYSPSQQQCIKCTEPNSIFNMFIKQCTRCEGDQQLDSDKKICRSKPHYTNFSKLQNWNLDGGSLPQINKNLTPCPDSKPYFNGIICVSCDLPYYWSVSANLCKQCQNGASFDLNTKKCQKFVRYQLTILQNTKWVSQNLTKIIEDRANILQKNKTLGNYQYCSSIANPFYDKTTCINCDYFDIDNLKCIEKPKETQYNSNMKKFLMPESAKDTNLNAKNYISSSKLGDTSLPNCNQTFPYYDGIACIQCLKPFVIFNIDEKKCVVCNGDEIYIQNLHICQPRKKIKVSDNFEKLLATPKVTVVQYKQSLIKTINDNTDAIIYPCPQKNQYSNLTDCFPCQENQYFNVQTLKCEFCDGTYFDINQTCKAKVYIFTNIKAGKIIDMDGTTPQNQNARISQFLKAHPQSYVCPLDRPYAIQNKTCGTCPDLFSYIQLKCKSCSQFYIYLSDTRKCVQAKMIVNFNDSHKILVSQTQTLTSFKDKEQAVKNQNPTIWKLCPLDRPYTQNRQFCFNCTQDSPYFNYTAKQCQSCPDHYVFDAVTVRCVQQFFVTLINSDTQPRMLGYDDYTMDRYRTEQEELRKSPFHVNCNQSEPFGTATGCKQCSQPNPYFDIKKKECSDVKYLINFQKMSPEYILPSDKKLDDFIKDEVNYKNNVSFLTKNCSADKPYTSEDRYSCFNCNVNSSEYYNFGTKRCEKCPDGQKYVRDLKICKPEFKLSFINNSTQKYMKGYQDYTLQSYKQDQQNIKAKSPTQVCQESTPYATQDGCRKCQQPTPYFDIKKLICSSAKKLINFSSINPNYILGDGKNLSNYQQAQKNYRLYSQSITVECPVDAPYTYDRENCFTCRQPESLFNFQTKKCQSCPRGSEFNTTKKQCLKLFYITNFNTDSQKKMVESGDYSVTNFKNDQQKLRKQNPYKNCTVTQPYGTVDGCKLCVAPEQYYDIKNRVCTAIKRLTNLDGVDKNVITTQGKTIGNYSKQQDAFEASSDLPAIPCPLQTPYTKDRIECFACKDPLILYNLQTKVCQKCQTNQAYDSVSKKCVKKQFYTLFNSDTETFFLQSDSYNLSSYKADQAKIKNTTGSTECPLSKPFASQTQCIQCNSSTPYFNIQLKGCQACTLGMTYFVQKHQCLLPAYMTDFTNKNIKETSTVKIADAKKTQQNRASQTGYVSIKCSSQKPFATLDGCIACTDSKAQYFNIQTLQCEGCRDFYQYFQNNTCKDNIVLTNTQEMIGYQEVENYTKYNVQKQNNFTYLNNDHVVDCPKDIPFYYEAQKICVPCDTKEQPVFDLKLKKCVSVQEIKISNPQGLKYYIQNGDSTLSKLKLQISVLRDRGVNVSLCPAEKPYFALNQCIICPDSAKYFNLDTYRCTICGSGQKCITV